MKSMSVAGAQMLFKKMEMSFPYLRVLHVRKRNREKERRKLTTRASSCFTSRLYLARNGDERRKRNNLKALLVNVASFFQPVSCSTSFSCPFTTCQVHQAQLAHLLT